MEQEMKTQNWEKEFEEKWLRIQKTMTSHLSGRKIWDVSGGEDEDSYVFVDETLKAFISDLLAQKEQEMLEREGDRAEEIKVCPHCGVSNRRGPRW